MILWRLSNQTDLAGRGGMRAPGRWHSVGHPIVYLAEHPASCLAELLAHDLRVEEIPSTYRWLEVDVDASVVAQTVGELAGGWPRDVAVTRRLGDAWLRSRSSVLLKTPSALSPSTTLYLLNPRHPQAALVRVTRVLDHPVETRFETSPPVARRRTTKKSG